MYTKPGCVQCRATARSFEALGIDVVEIDISNDPDAIQKMRDLGYMSAPVVFDGFDHWSGFRPDKIEEAVARRTPTLVEA